jgi:translation initiation factor IF-2
MRLNKIAKEFNVGVQTLVDSLQQKGVVVENNPNAKISDEHYGWLVKEFSKDKNLKEESDRISQQRHNKEKAKPAAPKEEAPKQPKQPKPAEEPKAQSKPQQPAEKAPAKPTTELVTPLQEAKQKVIGIKVVDHINPDTLNQKSASVDKKPETANKDLEKMQEKKQETNAAPAEKKDEVFRLNKPSLGSTLNVIGTIDLDALNQQTRPRKKSKEERRRERDSRGGNRPNNNNNHGGANAGDNRNGGNRNNNDNNRNGGKPQQGGDARRNDNQNGGAAGDDKKKRARINKQKVDVNAAANQPQHGSGDRDRNRNRNNDRDNRKPNNLKKPMAKAEVSDEDVQKQIKETLARLTNKGAAQKKGSKYRKEKREQAAERRAEEHNAEAAESKILKLTEFVTANDLANMMNISVNQVIGTCMSIGMMVSINQRLDAETINIVAEEFGYKTEYVSAEVVEAISVEADAEEDLIARPPIVTVMGHVDHGKTSLLDYIRKANVIAGEAGGITQHIGAYNVSLPDGRHVTFLDTPGHEAFTAMRARGAQVTDIAIIIVAADDAVMPQTIEAINHASAANVPIVFAINKIDKPHANPEKIKESLAQMNYLVEDWGGKYQSQEISAKQGIGVDELLEKVLLEAELLDLKANPNRRAIGSVIESTLDKGRGYVATVLVQNGTLRVGDIVLAGTHYGRVKAMFNERNQKVTEAGPAVPVQILGFNGAPQAGDQFHVMETEQEAREIANKREQLAREQGLRTQKILTLDDIGRRIAIGNFQELNVIVKGDVDGSVEALSDSLIKLSTPEIQVNVIHKAVGQISESDITLAAASNAVIIGFQVRPSLAARRLAEREGVEVRLYSIIYDAIEEVKDAMEGMLAPEIKEEIVAYLEIRETFKITKVGTVAGCIVKEGKIKRTNKIRVIRDGIVIYSGELGSLKRFKDDVKEVSTNFECGLNIDKFNDLKVGDLIEAYEETQVKKTL